MAEGKAIFSGLRKLIFKDEPESGDARAQPVPAPPSPPEKQASFPEMPAPAPYVPPVAPAWEPTSEGAVDEGTRAKAYQLLESINQPGVDFLEVWNAASENGGPSGVKTAFQALKFADKTLTREKIVSTGRYYIEALQKALQSDLEKKAAQQKGLEEEKATQRQSLSKELTDLEKQIADLQNILVQKRNALADLDGRYEPQLQELRQKMASGKKTIEQMLQQMHATLQAAEREL